MRRSEVSWIVPETLPHGVDFSWCVNGCGYHQDCQFTNIQETEMVLSMLYELELFTLKTLWSYFCIFTRFKTRFWRIILFNEQVLKLNFPQMFSLETSLTVFWGENVYPALSEQVLGKIILGILKVSSAFLHSVRLRVTHFLDLFRVRFIALWIYLIRISGELSDNSAYVNKLLFKMWS